MNQTRDIATYLLALSLFSLAGAIVYFSMQLASLSKDIPDILSSIEKTSDKVEPVIKEVSQIRELVPPITREVSEIRKQIPAILEEVKQVREQVPAVLEEVREIRSLIPQVVEEVGKTRQALPEILTRSEKLVREARTAGAEASEGAVTGFFKGIITAPFRLVGGLGKALFSFDDEVMADLSEADINQLAELTKQVLMADTKGTVKEWRNSSISYTGKVTLRDIEVIDGQLCKTIHVELWEKGKSMANTHTTFCQNKDGAWVKTK